MDLGILPQIVWTFSKTFFFHFIFYLIARIIQIYTADPKSDKVEKKNKKESPVIKTNYYDDTFFAIHDTLTIKKKAVEKVFIKLF